MNFRLSVEAAQDIVELVSFGIETFGEAQALKYHKSLEQLFELLSGMPELGREVPNLGAKLRRFEHGRHIVFYQSSKVDVLIVRVIDNRRDTTRLFS